MASSLHGLGLEPLKLAADPASKAAQYQQVLAGIDALISDEPDWISVLSTVASELHHAFDYFHWTGFYRMVPAAAAQPGVPSEEELTVGPYQGHTGCLRIALTRGVCGAAAREAATQLVPDVRLFPGYIACASSTLSEVVAPVIDTGSGRVVAVLDVDSDDPAAFDQVDVTWLETLCLTLGRKYAATTHPSSKNNAA